MTQTTVPHHDQLLTELRNAVDDLDSAKGNTVEARHRLDRAKSNLNDQEQRYERALARYKKVVADLNSALRHKEPKASSREDAPDRDTIWDRRDGESRFKVIGVNSGVVDLVEWRVAEGKVIRASVDVSTFWKLHALSHTTLAEFPINVYPRARPEIAIFRTDQSSPDLERAPKTMSDHVVEEIETSLALVTGKIADPHGLDDTELNHQRVIDCLGLASVYAEPSDVDAWNFAQRWGAIDWAQREHLVASDNAGVKRIPEPDHVKKLPRIRGIDPWSDKSGYWITRLFYPYAGDASEKECTREFIQIPGKPETRRWL